MHVHKPMPPRNWRELLGEIGIIVIGVLVALGAEQVVEILHWRSEVAHARQTLSQEFAGDIALADERTRLAPCLVVRIQQVAAILDKAAEAGRLPPVGKIGGPPDRTWTVPSWNAALASQTASHMSRTDLVTFGALADYANVLNRQNAEESLVWSDLNAIVGPGRPTSLEEIGRLRSALGRAHYYAKTMTFDSQQFVRWIRASGIASQGRWPDDPEPPGYVPVICRPLAAAPSTYGYTTRGSELPGWKN
jgi:hypothetical protein